MHQTDDTRRILKEENSVAPDPSLNLHERLNIDKVAEQLANDISPSQSTNLALRPLTYCWCSEDADGEKLREAIM